MPPFRDWPAVLQGMPSPLLVHPVGFGPGGFDASDPDLLPPDSRFGTLDELRAAFQSAQGHGDLVMPYLNVSWWNPQSPTIHELPPPLTPASISLLDQNGKPVTEQFSGFDGFVASPGVPFVRQRIQAEIERWGADAPADCRFFDQIGARPWRPDFNPAESSPVAYDDAWLSLFAPYGDRCLMVEDGWDRLAASFSGFQGGLLLMEREHHEPDNLWGAGNWRAVPARALAAPRQGAALSTRPVREDDDDRSRGADVERGVRLRALLRLGSRARRALALDRRRLPARARPALRRSRAHLVPSARGRRHRDAVRSYSVVANWNGTPYATAGYRIAPRGFLARTDDGNLVAGEFADPSGLTYRIVQNGQATFSAAVPSAG